MSSKQEPKINEIYRGYDIETTASGIRVFLEGQPVFSTSRPDEAYSWVDTEKRKMHNAAKGA